ncbi:MAG: GAF domain-containing protein [Bacteroidota bacterium]|nr:GAF domain-containing protein [Bacteroidota bacterium]
MTENIFIDQNLSDKDKYTNLLAQIESLLDQNDANVSNLSNFTAAIAQTLKKISWVGFYILNGDNLFLGPFQGKVACTNIKLGQGVCGKSALERKTIIVPDVNLFPGHIACDSESKSEIVVPLIIEDRLYGVLDVDSNSFNAFDQTDKEYLEKLCSILLKKLF